MSNTQFSFLEHMSAKHTLSKVKCSPLDRYHSLQLSFKYNWQFHLQCALRLFFFSVHILYKLGIFHKTGIPTQFVIQWLKSKYRTSEWGGNSEFLRLEGYTPGNYFFLGATLILTAENVLFFSCTYRSQRSHFRPFSKRVYFSCSFILVCPQLESGCFHASWLSTSGTGFFPPSFYKAQNRLCSF